MLYLGEKYDKFIPVDHTLRTEMMNWLFWAVSNLGPILGACFGHFFCYAPGVMVWLLWGLCSALTRVLSVYFCCACHLCNVTALFVAYYIYFLHSIIAFPSLFTCYDMPSADQHQARDYALGRYGMEVKRLMSVLNDHLLYREYMMNNTYTLADMAIFPWVHQLRQGYRHPSG